MRRLAYFVLAGTLLLAGVSHQDAIAQSAAPSTPVGAPTLAPVVDRVTPAVVNVAVLSRSPLENNPLLRDPFFRRFFDVPDAEQLPPQISAGSGVIVDAAKGYVITNHHVVANAEEIAVTLKDGRRFDAKLVGSDAGTDVALLQIEPDRLTDLPLGNSDTLKVGDFVLAIGNPFGLGQTVTMGIVSALGRSGLRIEGYEDFIQTDASINPGNSGGGLISLSGELMGINTAIVGPSGGNVGIGFAVPSNMARAVMEQLAEYGEVRRGRLGIQIQDLTPDLAAVLGLPADARGAVVTLVEPGSPADKAGVKPGDVVLAVNGRPLRDAADLRNRIGLLRVGEQVELKLVREGKEHAVRAQIASPEREAAAASPAAMALSGAVVLDISPDMPMSGKVQGVVVAEVAPGSPAWSHGLRPGDVIVAVNRKPVRNLAEFNAAISQAERAVALDVLRGDQPLFLVIT